MKNLQFHTLSLLLIFCHIFLTGFSQNHNDPDLHVHYGLPVLSGVSGFGLDAIGGKGGKIMIVTNLNKNGKGSLAEAINSVGPRIIVFEVAGVIDLDRKSLKIKNPFVTIAGQTAPFPGITLIKGGLEILTHEVIIQHIKVRPGEAGQAKASGWEVDGISTGKGAYNVIVDHCSCSWATDENLSASGPRFDGKDIDEWRKNTSHKITISNCIIDQGLSLSTHSKIEHSKGSLIHDNATEILIYGNLYADNMERNPLCKGGTQTAIVNNFIYNPGKIIIHYALNKGEWVGHDWVTGEMAIEGNCIEYGQDTPEDIAPAIFMGPVNVYWNDNQIIKTAGYSRPDREIRNKPPGLLLSELKLSENPPIWPEGLVPLAASEVKQHILNNAGAFPWERDNIDKQIIGGIISGKGKIIDSEKEAGGYPDGKPVFQKFNVKDWDLVTMTKKKSR